MPGFHVESSRMVGGSGPGGARIGAGFVVLIGVPAIGAAGLDTAETGAGFGGAGKDGATGIVGTPTGVGSGGSVPVGPVPMFPMGGIAGTPGWVIGTGFVAGLGRTLVEGGTGIALFFGISIVRTGGFAT